MCCSSCFKDLFFTAAPWHPIYVALSCRAFWVHSFGVECRSTASTWGREMWRASSSIPFQTQRKGQAQKFWKDLPKKRTTAGKVSLMCGRRVLSRKQRMDQTAWKRKLKDFLSASDAGLIKLLRADRLLHDWTGSTCPRCQKGKLSKLQTSNWRLWDAEATGAMDLAVKPTSIHITYILSSWMQEVQAIHLFKPNLLSCSCSWIEFPMLPFIASCTSTTRPLRTWTSAWCNFEKHGWKRKRSSLSSATAKLGWTSRQTRRLSQLQTSRIVPRILQSLWLGSSGVASSSAVVHRHCSSRDCPLLCLLQDLLVQAPLGRSSGSPWPQSISRTAVLSFTPMLRSLTDCACLVFSTTMSSIAKKGPRSRANGFGSLQHTWSSLPTKIPNLVCQSKPRVGLRSSIGPGDTWKTESSWTKTVQWGLLSCG